MRGRDLLPGEARIQLLQPAAEPAARAHHRRIFSPAPTAAGARLEVVMAGKAQHHQIGDRIVASADDAKPVVDVELPLGSGDAADLAAAASLLDEAPTPGRRQGGSPCPPVVSRSHPLTQGPLAQERRERTRAAGRAGAADHHQVQGRGGRSVVSPEEVEGPRPFQSAGFACSAAAAKCGGPGATIDV